VSPAEEAVRERLTDRRERLAAFASDQPEGELVELLHRVDQALGRLEVGAWGLCAVCHVAIEPDLLETDPTVSVCFECLSTEERRALERDLESAARVQRALLPARRLTHDGWEVAWLWEPKGAVSGDHVDLLVPEAPGGPLHLILGDVAGKGVAASLLQSHLHALFRALTSPDVPVADLLARANRLFGGATASASYATLVAARLSDDGTLELANAGHPRPLVADRRGVRPVEGSGLPLGLFPGAAYTGHRLRLEAGDVALLYTDGWTEAAKDGEEYGVGRAAAALRHAVGEAPGRSLGEILAQCRDDMEHFLDGEERPDDLTLVAVRRTA
jgi:sigma-B regulation protein RsbU (phosphoserine phosphatase)